MWKESTALCKIYIAQLNFIKLHNIYCSIKFYQIASDCSDDLIMAALFTENIINLIHYSNASLVSVNMKRHIAYEVYSKKGIILPLMI